MIENHGTFTVYTPTRYAGIKPVASSDAGAFETAQAIWSAGQQLNKMLDAGASFFKSGDQDWYSVAKSLPSGRTFVNVNPATGVVVAVTTDPTGLVPMTVMSTDGAVSEGQVYDAASNSFKDLPITSKQVSAERDRRMSKLTFQGKVFDHGTESRMSITHTMIVAMSAIVSGKSEGDLRWSGPDEDFTWPTASNEAVPMDAPTMMEFGKVSGQWRQQHIAAARAIKDLGTIPADYKNNSYWP